ncbi:MAG: choice-of-anchor D domain-containing protein [Acidobacteriia bacterium]|nr:choice-of-anchor D domain-containing protein [Terriglobia bacterium]
MILVLQASPEQEHALNTLLDQQQDKTSPNYHRWLTPDDFGQRFGVAPEDLQKVADWLGTHNLAVEKITASRRGVIFGGTAGDVERAFHTEIHRYLVNGEHHFSNSTDISIPGALHPIVSGVHAINDFGPKPLHSITSSMLGPGIGMNALFTGVASAHFLAPGDFATIYNTAPLLNRGFDGTGVKIAIISLSDIDPQNVLNFRSLFLPGYPVNAPTLFTPGQDPQRTADVNEVEADLDIEWAGAIAPGATIINVASTSLETAATYAVDANVADIISVSFGSCEVPASSIYQTLWAQAAAQGITVFVSSGDTGVAGCDAQRATAAQFRYAVNMIASTPYNIAVGGTEFSENIGNALYWDTTNGSNLASALTYIPEQVWNETCANNTVTGDGTDCDSGTGLWSSSGGVSILYSKPNWQIGPGVPLADPISVQTPIPGPHRYLPDVALAAAMHDGYMVCTFSSGCSLLGSLWTGEVADGTSAAAPSFAGIQAIIDQQYGRQGQANYVYYQLAAKPISGSCDSTSPNGPDPRCIFRDITMGSNRVPCVVGASNPDCPLSGIFANSLATSGYDLATGLGSVNAANLFDNWLQATPRSTTLQLEITNPSSAVASPGQPVVLTAMLTVPDNAWGPPPTGVVTIFDGTTQLGQFQPLVLDSTKTEYITTFTTSFSSTGTHSIQARYSDSNGNYLGATSPSLTVTIQAAQTLPTLTSLAINPSSITTGQTAMVTATLSGPAPNSGAQIGLTSSNSSVFPLPATINVAPGQSSGTTPPIVPGTVSSTTSVTVQGSYNSSSQIATVTIGPASTSSVLISLNAAQTSVTPGQTVTFTAVLSGANGPAPTGSLSFFDTFNGVATLVGTGALSAGPSGGQYTASGSEQLNAVGVHAITAIYNGDVHYGSAISNVANIVVQQSQSGPVLASLTITPFSIVGGFSPQGVITLTGPAPVGTTVFLKSNNTAFAQVPAQVDVTAGATTRAFLITTFFTTGTQGATITADYNNTLAGASLTVLPVGISGVSFFPNSVTAGTPANITVFLTGPAAPGTILSLVSSDPSVLQVPSSVPLPTGATSVSVTGATSPVALQTSVTLTATYNLNAGQASLTVVPAPPITLNSFSFSPGTITGGSSVSGTVFLTGAAPSGGASVSISSSSGLVPSIVVTVPEGSVSAPFTLTSGAVGTVTNVSLTASYGGISQTGTLTLVPPLPFLASLSFSPSTIDSGLTTTGTVTLTAPAPLGGAGIALSNDVGFPVAGVSSSFNTFVPAGSISATFTIHTSPIQFIARVTVVASYNGGSVRAPLTIVPPGTPTGPSSLSLSPSTTVGGTQSTGTIQLTNPAPAGGLPVSLASDSTSASVPLSITVPAGATAAAFSIGTLPVSGISTATITASSNGVSQSTLLTLTPTGPSPAGSPVPLLTAPLAPVSQTPGGADLSLTLKGTGFVPGAKVLLDGNPLATTFVSSSILQTVLPGANVRGNLSGAVSVANNGSLASSNRLPLHLTFPTSAPVFTNSSLSLSGSPRGAAFADFNRDGKLDMVIGKSDGTGITVLLGNGDGTFGPELLLPTIDPFSVIAADFNADGKPDIAAICGSVVLVFLGNGDGTFTNGPRIPLPSSSGNDLVAGDFNADGRLDIAVTGAPGVWVLLGNGDGTFQSPANSGTVAFPTSIAAADFNQDGKLDLVVNDSSNQSVAILFGNGDGTFQAQSEVSTNGFANSLTVADFNGDGFPDIAVANQGPIGSAGAGLAVLLGRGDGTFSPAVNYFAGENFFFVTTDDMNGDGKLDLLAVPTQFARTSNILVLGNGDGTFSPTAIPVGGTPTGSPLFIADINDDGAPDVLVTTTASGSLPLLIQSIAPILQVTPATISFDAIQGGSAIPPVSVTIANTGGGTASWTATASDPWIALDQSSGTAPSVLTVSATTSSLAAGTYHGSISIAATSASNLPINIDISLTIQPPPVVLESISFNPNTLSGAGTSAGFVTLSAVAPAGGAAVSITSDNPVVQVPAVITVPAGTSTAPITASVASVSTVTSVTVSATYNQTSTQTLLTLVPPAPTADLSTASVGFADQLVGSTSAPAAVTLSNAGNAPLPIASVTLTGTNAGDFSETNSCGTSLTAESSCTISITFAPTAAGTRTATVAISDGLGVQSIALNGAGLAPAVTLSTLSVAFTNQPVGTSSASQAITVQNTGTAPLPITSVALGGGNASDFSQTNTCGTNLPAGTNCVVNVTFAPVTIGSKAASVVLTDSLGTQNVTLSGTGTGALAILSPSSLSFPNQPLGTPSTAQSLTLSNNGNVALNVTSISVIGANSADFSQTNNCGASVGVGLSCAINVTFTPIVAGNRNASITVVDDTGTQNAAVTGVGTAPVVSLSASNITFAAQAIGTTSPAQVVTLSNSGNGALAISSLSVTGANATDFVQANTCGTGVAAGSTCTINISFTPTAIGTRTASITISDNAGTQIIALSGTGLISGPAVQLTPTSLSFGIQAVGTTSSARTINVTNVGSVALSIASISVTGTNRANFAQTNTCGTSVAVGATCTISVTFTPSAAGPRTAAVTLKDGAGTQTVALDGTGQAALGVSPTSIAFGNQALGSAGTAHTVTISNNTGVLVNVASIAVTGTNGADFQQLSSTCGPTLAFKSSCTINLVFAPSALGARTATLNIVDDATNSPQAVTLSGTGIVPVAVTSASLAFAARAVGTTSASKNVTIKNNLPTILTISSIVFGGANPGDFTQSATTCGTTLAAGASCTVSIVFAPTAVGSRSAVLNITDGAITSPQSVALTGTGN